MLRRKVIEVVAGSLYEDLLLVRGFVRQQSLQIKDYADNLERYVEEEDIETIVSVEENKEELVSLPARHIEGVFEHDFDLKAIFTEVMPIYQRQAMLITIWSRFGEGLLSIANTLAGEKGINKKPRSARISDVVHYYNEVQRLGLTLDPSKELNYAVSFMSNVVGKVRNAWVHDGGKAKKSALIDVVNLEENLSFRNDLINVKEAFLAKVLDTMIYVAESFYRKSWNYPNN
ncbi:MAG TPA: hypothetical protein DHU56_04230 [Marinobacter sp.]|nr:hypothetical protein [Marinobacter sp.]